jgi:hypothetical protein
MGFSGVLLLLAGAFAFGSFLQSVGAQRTNLRWLGTGFVAAIGGYLASEFVAPPTGIGGEWDGLALLPAAIAVVLIAVLAELTMRRLASA